MRDIPMKLVLSGAALLILATGALGQITENRHPQIYIDREKTAPADILAKLQTHRKRILTQKLHFTVGYTFADEHPLKEITGGQRITDPNIVIEHKPKEKQLLDLDAKWLQEALKADPNLIKQIPILAFPPSPTAKKFDWRSRGVVSPVRSQVGGTCWIYAAVGILESSSKLENDQLIDGSEHYVICNDIAGREDPNDWNAGGWGWKAADYLVTEGTRTEAQDPEGPGPGTPHPNVFKPYGGTIWGFCHGTNGMATVAEIKDALCHHGPVLTWIDAGGTFGNYTGGVYDDKDTTHDVGGHFVDIIGWDDTKSPHCWIIRNSWGDTTWGAPCGIGSVNGYAYVGYGIHGIGTDAVWIHDHPTHYKYDRNMINKILHPEQNIRQLKQFGNGN